PPAPARGRLAESAARLPRRGGGRARRDRLARTALPRHDHGSGGTAREPRRDPEEGLGNLVRGDERRRLGRRGAAPGGVRRAGRGAQALESHAVRLDDQYPERESLVATCDVTKEDDVRAMFGAAVERFGRLDILVNTAGVIGPIETPAQDVSADDFRHVLDVN